MKTRRKPKHAMDPMRPTCELSRDERFFWDNSGYSWNAATETREDGRTLCAILSAAAECVLLEAIRVGAADVEVHDDPEGSREYGSECHGMALIAIDGVSEHRSCIASLWGIDDVNPQGYGRVVRAELAHEACAELIRTLNAA